jgi:hypothetical protein
MAKAIWAKVTWHAYYFNSLDRTSPVARTAIIEADNEEEAGKIAIAQMGRCMRVNVARPMWGAPRSAIRAPRSLTERPAMRASVSLAQ